MRNQQRITIKDVAIAAGVSRSTAAYIMAGNTKYSFQNETISRVHEAARALHYIANPIAASLRTQHNNIIIGVFGNVFYEMELAVSQALKDAFFKRGYYFVAQFMTNMTDKDKIEFFHKINRWGAGLVIYAIGLTPDSPFYDEMLELLAACPPALSLFNEINGSQADYLEIQWFKNLPEIFDYFRSLNRHRVVYCCGDTEPEIEARFRSVAAEYGMEAEIWFYPEKYTTDDRLKYIYHLGEMAAEHILSHPENRPDAICCFSDEIVLAIEQNLIPHGFRFPDDIAIVGGGDRRYVSGQVHSFPIFSFNPLKMAEMTADYLVNRIERGEKNCGSHCCVGKIDEHFVPQEPTDIPVSAKKIIVKR